MGKLTQNISDASLETTLLPVYETCALPGGRQLAIRRLSWLEFEALWRAVSNTLAALLLHDEEITEERLAAELQSAPQVVARLVQLSSGVAPEELARWSFDDVLAAGAVAARLNFIESRGLRDFFGSVQQLAPPVAAAASAGR